MDAPGDAVQQCHAVDGQACRDDPEQEELQRGLGSARVVTTQPDEDKGRKRNNFERDEQRDEVASSGERHHPGER